MGSVENARRLAIGKITERSQISLQQRLYLFACSPQSVHLPSAAAWKMILNGEERSDERMRAGFGEDT